MIDEKSACAVSNVSRRCSRVPSLNRGKIRGCAEIEETSAGDPWRRVEVWYAAVKGCEELIRCGAEVHGRVSRGEVYVFGRVNRRRDGVDVVVDYTEVGDPGMYYRLRKGGDDITLDGENASHQHHQ